MKDLRIKKLPYDFVIMSTIGDGSCFLHSVLLAFNSEYRKENNAKRKKIVYKLRKDLSNVLIEKEDDKSYYQNLSRGEIENISKALPDLQINNMKKYLNSHRWLNIYYLELISNQLNIDILIYNQRSKKFYITGDEEIYHKGRNTIIINYIEDCHFETIGVKMKSGIKTFFTPDCEIIENIKKEYYRRSSP